MGMGTHKGHSADLNQNLLKKVTALVLCILLVFSFVPLIAWANDYDTGSLNTTSYTGSYSEHEAIVCVIDEEQDSPYRLYSESSSLLDSATPLMQLSEQTMQDISGVLEQEEHAADTLSSDAISLFAAGTSASTGTLKIVRDGTRSTEQLIAELEADSRVLFAEPNYLVEPSVEEEISNVIGAIEGETDGATGEESENESASHGSETPDLIDATIAAIEDENSESRVKTSDVNIGLQALGISRLTTQYQWGNSNTGREAGSSIPTSIDVDYGAWNSLAGYSPENVVVAVVDSGIDASNTDLANKMWSRSAYPALASIGDEHGFSAEAGTLSTNDDSGHGTHCAGIIGAEWNNVGTSGVSRNVRLMAVKHANDLESVLECFDYIKTARAAGVNVATASCSWTLGSGQSQALNAAVTEMGEAGTISVFASGNSSFDTDASGTTPTTYRENPYAIVVDSVDPTGAISPFSNYGIKTTQIMAPGSHILSTYPVAQAGYLAEADNEPVIYESYDNRNRQNTLIPMLTRITFPGGLEKNYTKRFEGDSSLALSYTAGSTGDLQNAESQGIDLSSAAADVQYISIRYASETDPTGGGYKAAALSLEVKLTTNEWYPLESKGTFAAFGDAWGGLYAELPANTDLTNFSIRIKYRTMSLDMTGGAISTKPCDGTLLVDSIGIGSTLVPYAYLQGTSMACPYVSGIAAVLAETYGDSTAEKRAARVKGSYNWHNEYTSRCLSGGLASVDEASDPAPVITQVNDLGSTFEVVGYFFGTGPAATIGGQAITQINEEDLGDDKRRLTFSKPVGFAGGETEILIENSTGSLKEGRYFANIGTDQSLTYYDNYDLPVFDELSQWSYWQLVGYNGMIYCLPQGDLTHSMPFNKIWQYDPSVHAWNYISLPQAFLDAINCPAGTTHISGATYDEKLVLSISDDVGGISFFTYDAQGAWMQLPTYLDNTKSMGFSTLASDGKNLYLFGGMTATSLTDIARIDLAGSNLITVGSLQAARLHPNVSYRDGSFLVSGGIDATKQMGSAPGAELVTIEGDVTTNVEVDFSPLVTETGQLVYSSGAIESGFMLGGPISNGGMADTYQLTTVANMSRAPSSLLPTTYSKRAADSSLLNPASTGYNNAFYVMAATSDSPYRIFSSTAVSTVIQPGDVGTNPNPNPADPSKATAKTLAPTGDVTPLCLIALIATLFIALAAIAFKNMPHQK